MTIAEESSLRFWSILYSLGAYAVMVGVVMEGSELLARGRLRRKSRPSSEPWHDPPAEPRSPKWAHALEKWGLLILICGLLVEQLSHHKLEQITNRERNRLTAELSSTTKNAAAANERAGNAIERAAITESNNLVLQSNIVQLRITNAMLAVRVEELRAANIERQKELAKLSANFEIWQMTDMEAFYIRRALSPSKEKIFVILTYRMGGKSFGESLMGVLGGGFAVERMRTDRNTLVDFREWLGLTIFTNPDQEPPGRAVLKKALDAGYIFTTWKTNKQVNLDTMVIVVGARPWPVIQ